MNVLDRLQTLFGLAVPPPELPPSGHQAFNYQPPLGSIARDIEEGNWESLLDDIDRFSLSFNKDPAPPPS